MADAVCFMLLATVGGICLYLGARLGRGFSWIAKLVAGVGFLALVAWVWLQRTPTVAMGMIPASVMSYLEGTGGVLIFMLLAGIAWGWSRLPRQRRVVGAGVTVAALYFVYSGAWMLQSTPTSAFARTTHGPTVFQSADYSCVPAACAAALHGLGVVTSEAEMAELTQTRPRLGTTLYRTVGGLERRLEGTGLKPRVVQADWDQLHYLPMPALTLLQFQATRQHMVTVLEVRPATVLIGDPADGMMWLSRSQYEEVATGRVVAFYRTPGAANPLLSLR